METMGEKIARLREIKQAIIRGDEEKVAKHHERGKLTARERIDRLLDPGSFVELSSLVGYKPGTSGAGDGVIAGHGKIDGRQVCIFAQDTLVSGGSIGGQHGYKITKTTELGINMGVPVIGLNDSPGARAARYNEKTGEISGAGGTGGYIFYYNTQASGIVPQLSAILGTCAGIAVYSPAITDFIFMVDGISHMFITGPRIIKSVLSEEVDMETLGGAKVHSQVTGICDIRTKTEDDCFLKLRKLLSFLPSNNRELPPVVDTGDDSNRMIDSFEEIIPVESRRPYDMHRIIDPLIDNHDFFEIKPEFARELIIGFARLDGQTVGIIANQPMVYGGGLTTKASIKEARFIRFCDAFNIPMVFLVDTPAYVPGIDQEHGGIICHGAQAVYALCEATVPKVVLILRKVYGGGALGMPVLRGEAADFVLAWPTAEYGVLGPEQTVELFYAEDIKKAENPEALREKLVKAYRDAYADPVNIASLGFVHATGMHIEDIIEPRESRKRLISALQLLRTKREMRKPERRHGNIPL